MKIPARGKKLLPAISHYIFIFIFLLERQGEILHPLVHSSNACNSQVWSRPEPGGKDSIKISQAGGRDPTTWVIFCCLPRHIISRLCRTQTGILAWDTSIVSGHLTGCVTISASKQKYFNKTDKKSVIIISRRYFPDADTYLQVLMLSFY